MKDYITTEEYIYKTFMEKIKHIFLESKNYLFDKEEISKYFKILANDDKYDRLKKIINDKFFDQYLNSILSKLYLKNEVYRIFRGLYSFSSHLIDFKISLEKELSNNLIKNIILENKLSNSEAITLERNIFIPENLIKEHLTKEEREIFFKKFEQYKLIKLPSKINKTENITFISLAKFYNKNDKNHLQYIKNSISLLENEYSSGFNNKITPLIEILLKFSKYNKSFKYSHILDFVTKIKKEINSNAN